MEQYGPFAAAIAIAGSLVVSFATLIFKMFGFTKKWALMSARASATVPMLGARVVGVVTIAFTYLRVSRDNGDEFLLLAAGLAVLAVIALVRFNGLREQHVLAVPVVARDGQQVRDGKGNLLSTPILIGREQDMQENAREQLAVTRRERGGLSLADFVAGYALYDPEAIWSREYLARLANKLMVHLMVVFFCAAVALFVAALVVAANLS